MKTVEILNIIHSDELEKDVKSRFGLDMGDMSTYTCDNDEAERLKAYLEYHYKGIRLYVSEDSDKYLGAIVTWNADPCLVEDSEHALKVMRCVQVYGLNEIIRDEEPEEYTDAMDELNLTDDNNVKRIYRNPYITICLAGDWEAC